MSAPRSALTRRPGVLQLMTTVALTLAAAYAALAIFAWLFADSLLFPAPRPSYADQPGQNKLPAPDGNSITAVHLPNPAAPFVLLYCHGNGEDLGHCDEMLRALHARGWEVFAFDYPGYGTSTGRPSEAGCHAALAAAYSYLTAIQGVPPSRIVLYGRSLGSGPAVALAAREPVAGVILEGAFTSTFRVVTKVKLLPWDRFDNLAVIRGVRPPLLSIHAREDNTVPFAQGEALYAAHRGPKRSLWVAGAGHNNILETAPEAYWDALDTFRHSLPPPVSAVAAGIPASAAPPPAP